MFCDLHLHSTASDGTTAPSEVVRLARDAGLAAMALTDHDTFAGLPEAMDAGRRLGVRVVPGVELSLPHEHGTFHMIALGVDVEHAGLLSVTERLRSARGPRNAEILAKLGDLGVDVSLAEVEEVTQGDVVARPHIAHVLVRRGFVRDIQEAFDRYLGRGAAAYAERERVTFEETVEAVHGAGGATVLCHPFTLGFRVPGLPEATAKLRGWLEDMSGRGLDAIEVRYGSYSRADERRWEGFARDAGLLFSGGSDFHGDTKPGLKVGTGRGRMRVPLDWLEVLTARGAERRSGRAAETRDTPPSA